MKSWRSRLLPSSAGAAPSREKGLALLLVLWIVLILGLLSSQVLQAGRSDLLTAQNVLQSSRAQAFADGAIDAVLSGLISGSRNSLSVRADGSIYGWRFADSKLFVRVTAESGRIDINNASFATLSRLISASGAPDVDAEAVASAIVDYRSVDGGGLPSSTPNDYLVAPKHAPFQSVLELMSIDRMTEDLFSRIDDAVTILSGQATPDLNAASPLVRAAVQGTRASELDTAIDIATVNLSETPRVLVAGNGAATLTGAPIRVNAAALTDAGGFVSLESIVQLAPGSMLPYRLLARRNSAWLGRSSSIGNDE
jgi:general secretion pathway protein K